MSAYWHWKGPAAAFIALAPLLACTVGPNFSPPAAPPETDYTPAGSAEHAAGDQHFKVGDKISGNWWTLYRSEPLKALVEQAIAGNRSLVAARATLAASLDAVAQSRGGLFPQIDVPGVADRYHQNGAQLGLQQLPAGFPHYANLFRVGPTVNYTLDIWGGIARSIEASGALADAQEYQLDAAYLTLTGNAVLEAITIASLRAQIATVNGIIADDEANLRLVQTEVNAGVSTQLDIETAKSQMALDRTLLPPLRQQVSVANHALAILVGKAPASWTPPEFDLDGLVLPKDLPLNLPSELVRQRPDVLAAEAELHAASAQIGVATAQLYPTITLSAALSQQAISLDTLFHGASNIWSLGPSITVPLFHGGALEAQRKRAEDLFNASLATYEQTVLNSFGQVADILEALNHDAELLDEQQRALDAAESSLALTRRTYAIGSIGIIQVTDAQRQAEQARLGFVRARAQRYLDTAQLFLAMGGGWWEWRARDVEPSVTSVTPVSAPAQ